MDLDLNREVIGAVDKLDQVKSGMGQPLKVKDIKNVVLWNLAQLYDLENRRCGVGCVIKS